jgi:hypothetical protein
MDFMLLSAAFIGFAVGIIFAVGVLLNYTRSVEEDCENHYGAAIDLGHKLAHERQKNEHLTTQVETLLTADTHTHLRDIRSVSIRS